MTASAGGARALVRGCSLCSPSHRRWCDAWSPSRSPSGLSSPSSRASGRGGTTEPRRRTHGPASQRGGVSRTDRQGGPTAAVLALGLQLPIPRPLALGAPTSRFPGRGRPAVASRSDRGSRLTIDPQTLADDLGAFLADLQHLDPTGGAPPSDDNFFRGGLLTALFGADAHCDLGSSMRNCSRRCRAGVERGA